MKKFTLMFVLLLVLSISALAEGEIPIGGKSCPNGQNCLVSSTEISKDIPTQTFYKDIFDFLKSIFE